MFRDDLGNELDLLHLSPALVEKLVREAARRWSDRAALERLHGGESWAAPIFWDGPEQVI